MLIVRCAFVIFIVFNTKYGHSQDVLQEVTTALPKFTERDKLMSEHILEILEHFKTPDPVGIPGANIQDPYPVPDLTKSLTFDTIYFKNTAVYGVSKFRILYVNADIENMEVQAATMIDKLQTRGNYTYCSSFMCFNKIQGPFTVDVTRLKVTGRATLAVELDGKLRAQDVEMDMKFDTIALNFENLGIWGSLIQGLINTLSNFIFESIKPYILKDSCANIRAAINKKLDELAGDEQFPNTISPLDMLIVDARNAMRENGMDPFKMKDQNVNKGVIAISISNTWITGLSTVHRIGNITLKMENAAVEADFEIGTQTLNGSTQLDISVLGGIISAGAASFSVEYLHGRIIIAQPLDTRKRPELRDFKLELGNIQVRSDGAGTADYIIELSVNILPNLLRYELIQTLEGPLKMKLQEGLNTIDVEELLRQELPKLDEIKEDELKLSSLRAAGNKFDEDEFFNF